MRDHVGQGLASGGFSIRALLARSKLPPASLTQTQHFYSSLQTAHAQHGRQYENSVGWALLVAAAVDHRQPGRAC